MSEAQLPVAGLDSYAVVGYPVAHSKSPMIHRMFSEQTGQKLVYGRMEVNPENFSTQVKAFFSAGGCGLNITLPHKESAWSLVDWRADNAQRAGAVNTLYRLPDGRLAGDNTDGTGLVSDIEKNHGGDLAGKRILILGAGGAVRGVIPRLLSADPAAITIVNRTVERAVTVAAVFEDLMPIKVLSYEQLAAQTSPYDWIINGSAAGLQGQLPALPDGIVDSQSACYDMVYAPGGTVFQEWANVRGARLALDGVGMLVEQAAASFHIWRGVRPDTAPVIKALRQSLAS